VEQKIWLPSPPDAPKGLDRPAVLSVISLAATVLFGVLGIANVIPLYVLIPTLIVCAVFLFWALWQSEWLSKRGRAAKLAVLLGIGIVYLGMATPAVLKLLSPDISQTFGAETQRPRLSRFSTASCRPSGLSCRLLAESTAGRGLKRP
jgi:hypothetical protein